MAVCKLQSGNILLTIYFTALHNHHSLPQVYTLERADGVGKAADLVLQGFIRFSSLFILPTVLSSTLFYLMVSVSVY